MTPHKRTPLLLTLVALLALGSLAPSAVRAAEVDPTLAAELQRILDDFRVERPVPGVAAAVILADGSRWQGASGRADLAGDGVAMTAATPSVVGSVTKTFVAALILQLVAEGRLKLKTRLSRWFPELPFARSVRVRHLLRHTSGLADYFGHPDYSRLVFKRPDHHWTPDEILTLVRPRLLFAPGQGWAYSNTNYLFLGLIAERVTGHDLGSELDARFFEPYALADTQLQADAPAAPGAAHGYLLKKAGFVGYSDGSDFRPNTSAATVAWAAGGIVSTAPDIATWTHALYSGKVVSKRLLKKMTRFNDSGYGFATMLFKAAGNAGWGHTGSLRGYEAMTWYVPAAGVTVSVLINRGRINPVPIARQLTRAIYAWSTSSS